MTNDELDRLEALANAATPGPWHVNRRDEVCMRLSDGTSFAIADSYGGGGDSAFIAAASPDVVLRLIAELREARTERDQEAGRDYWCDTCRCSSQSSEHATCLVCSDDVTHISELAGTRTKLERTLEERDRLAAELTDARAEIDRLRTMVPSKGEIAEIRYAFGCTDYRPKDALAWLTRIESAKETGR